MEKKIPCITTVSYDQPNKENKRSLHREKVYTLVNRVKGDLKKWSIYIFANRVS